LPHLDEKQEIFVQISYFLPHLDKNRLLFWAVDLESLSKMLTYIATSYSKAAANRKPEEFLEKFSDATAQLNIYATDEKVKNMTEGTNLHKIVIVFKGLELEKIEEVL
jgi:hypothetical protein